MVDEGEPMEGSSDRRDRFQEGRTMKDVTGAAAVDIGRWSAAVQ